MDVWQYLETLLLQCRVTAWGPGKLLHTPVYPRHLPCKAFPHSKMSRKLRVGKSELTALFIRTDGQKGKQPKADDTELLSQLLRRLR